LNYSDWKVDQLDNRCLRYIRGSLEDSSEELEKKMVKKRVERLERFAVEDALSMKGKEEKKEEEKEEKEEKKEKKEKEKEERKEELKASGVTYTNTWGGKTQ